MMQELERLTAYIRKHQRAERVLRWEFDYLDPALADIEAVAKALTASEAKEAKLERMIEATSLDCRCGAFPWCPGFVSSCKTSDNIVTACKAHIRAWLDTEPKQEAPS
jgi:hypothetical protein